MTDELWYILEDKSMEKNPWFVWSKEQSDVNETQNPVREGEVQRIESDEQTREVQRRWEQGTDERSTKKIEKMGGGG